MSTSSLLPPSNQAKEVSLDLICPDSLRRQGPAIIDLVDERGMIPRVGRGGFHLQTGKWYTLQVQPQQPDDSGKVTKLEIKPGRWLFALDTDPDPRPGELAARRITFRPQFYLPIPGRTDLVVQLHHDRWGGFKLTIPVVVWPSLLARFLWLLTGILFPLFGMRVQTLVVNKNRSSLQAVFESICDVSFWSESLLILVAGVVLLWMVGWVWLALGGRSD
jgi:hypothetical protein